MNIISGSPISKCTNLVMCKKILYIFGYCPTCCAEIPEYIPSSQWKKWVDERYEKIK